MSNKSSDSQRIDVFVGGVTYHLIAHENESYTREIATKVDKALKSISNSNPSLSGTQAKVLLLINLFDNLTKTTDLAEKLKTENEKLATDNEEKKKELFVQCDINFELKKELLRINELNKQLTLQLATLQGYESDEEPTNEEFAEDESTEEDISLRHEIIPPDIAPPEDYKDSYQPSIDEYFSNS